MKAIRFHRHGGTEVLVLDELEEPTPGPGQVLVGVEGAGVNFIDVYLRTGFYPSPSLPAIAGKEGAGRVERLGPGVTDLALGQRVAFFDAPGAYAEKVVVDAHRLVPVPEGISGLDAAAVFLQGMTAHYLTHTIRPLKAGDRVLIHAVAGGVGLLATQMAKLAGAEVFGTCSTPEKAELARSFGADHVILYTEQDFVAEILAATGGQGVDLAIDGVGKTTFEGSVRATRMRGHIIFFGQSSGEPDPIRPRRLLGSRTLTCASLFEYCKEREELLERAAAVFGWMEAGQLKPHIHQALPLAEAARAHQLLEGRKTRGKLVLVL
jgi:NADPH2:quinone reductase